MHVNPSGGFILIQKYNDQESADEPDDWLSKFKPGMSLWEDTMAGIADPVFFVTGEGMILGANNAGLSFFGVEESDLLGMHCYEMIRKFGLRYSDCPFDRIFKSKKPEEGLMEYGGEWHNHRMAPVLGEDGEMQGAISVITDASDNILYQAAAEQLEHLMGETDNAVMVTDLENTIVRWNKGTEDVFGYGPEELKGTQIHDLVPLSFRDRFAAYVDRVQKEEESVQFSMQGLTKNAEVVDVDVSLSPLHDPFGEVSGMMALSRDVSGEHDVDMRLVQYLTDSAVKVNGPLSHMRTNMEETVAALQDGLLTTEELVMFLTLQMKAIGHIEENLADLNQLAIDGIDAVPERFRKYLSRKKSRIS